MSGISVNEDSTQFYYTRTPEDMTEGGVDAFIDTYANTSVREMMFNVNAHCVSYPSQVWEPLWRGYDPDGNHDEGFERKFSGKVGSGGRLNLVHNLHLLEKRGIDPFARWIDKCRAVKISPWISLRMNDLHYLQMPLAERRKLLEAEDPALHRVTYRTCMTLQDGAPDYSQPAVYAHYMALVREVAERYDMDGLEMDFSRHFWFLKPGRGIADQEVMTRFVRETRQVLDEQEQRRGHSVRLNACVPSTERSSRWLGMDVVLWAREDLVDYVIPTPRWYSVDFGMPIDEWKRLLDGTGAMLGARLEPRVLPHPDYPVPKECRNGLIVNSELVRGAAATYLHHGADRIVLMNFFDNRRDLQGRLLLQECGLLNEVGSLESLQGKPRRHMITFQDAVAPGEVLTHALPLAPRIGYKGDPCFGELRIDTGPRPAQGKATVILGFTDEAPDPPSDFQVYVNGCKAMPLGRVELEAPAPMPAAHGFDLPIQALNDGHNLMEIMSDALWALHWAEIRLSD